MALTHNSHPTAPVAPGAPRSLPVSSASASATNAPESPVTPPETPPLPEDGFVAWDAGPDPTIALCEYNVEGDWELRRDLAELSIGGSS